MRQITKEHYDNLFRCIDCGINTHRVDEYYMVTNPLWNSVVRGGMDAGMLCIGCLETRLGRRLIAQDFVDAPINKEGVWFGKENRFSNRLANRLGFDTVSENIAESETKTANYNTEI